ncbi:MAG: shikimate dehydrogenase [Clostridia bacterium]|nr:shikimate dehydrogenase [Clostridia bacterium]
MAEKKYRAELVGVFGDPVDGNPTGVVEEAGFAATRLNYRYITCLVKRGDIANAILGMRAMNMRGVNLTMPHKVDVLPYLDEITPAARIIGAVNTVVNRGGHLLGENTDGKGFVKSLTDEGIDLHGKTVCLLGAGGAARAIGVECALNDANKIIIVNRNAERGTALRDAIAENTDAQAEYIPWAGTAPVPEQTDILVNATCVGLFPDVNACPDIDYETIEKGMIVCDVVFNPAMPVFLQKARQRGARTISGLGMLVNQAALNFEIWTDVKAPREVMLEALRREF